MNLEQEPALVKIEESRPDLDLWRAWERRRLIFNSILVGFVVAIVVLVRRDLLFDLHFGNFLIAQALLANLCFCAGPVADGYLHRMGLGGLVSARVLFAGGLVIAVPMTALSVLLYNFRVFD